MKSILFSSEKIRFLIFGLINSLFGWIVFSLCQLISDGDNSYIYSLIVSYCLGTLTSFLLQRFFVFMANGNVYIEFLRYSVVYVPQLIVNILLLPEIAVILGINLVVAQIVFIFISAIVSYLGHKYFSFKTSSK